MSIDDSKLVTVNMDQVCYESFISDTRISSDLPSSLHEGVGLGIYYNIGVFTVQVK